MTHSKIEMAMAVETLNTADHPHLLALLIECNGWQDHRWWLRGVDSYHQGVPPNQSGESWTRDEAATWQQGWDFAHARNPYAADAWPEYEAPKPPIKMRVNVTGLLGNVRRLIDNIDSYGYRTGLRDLAKHLREMKARFEAGDHDVVAEFFDLYTVEG